MGSEMCIRDRFWRERSLVTNSQHRRASQPRRNACEASTTHEQEDSSAQQSPQEAQGQHRFGPRSFGVGRRVGDSVDSVCGNSIRIHRVGQGNGSRDGSGSRSLHSVASLHDVQDDCGDSKTRVGCPSVHRCSWSRRSSVFAVRSQVVNAGLRLHPSTNTKSSSSVGARGRVQA